MSPPKGITGFCCRVLISYGLLVLPWPGLQPAYAAFYRGLANLTLGGFSSDIKIGFRELRDDDDRLKDVELAIRRTGTNVERTTPINSRQTGYLPTAELVALILASPIPWARRGGALLWGLLLSHVVIFIRLAITLLYALTHQPPYIVGVSQGTSDLVYRIYEVAMKATTVSFVLPMLIWMAVTFRRGDLAAIIGPSDAAGERPRERPLSR